MQRRFILSIAWLAFTAFSCAVERTPEPVHAVSAPPPTAEAVVEASVAAKPAVAAKTAKPAVAARAIDPAVAATIAFLETKRTGLVGSEIEALARTIIEESRRHRLDPQLVLALMHVESRFYNFAVSKVGALGLMQILPSTGRELAGRLDIPWRGPRTLFDPVVNVRLGVAYMSQLAARYDHLPTALAAYNWGPGHIDGRLRRGRPLPKQYPGLVLDAYATAKDVTRS